MHGLEYPCNSKVQILTSALIRDKDSLASKLAHDVWRFQGSVLRDEHMPSERVMLIATKLALVGYTVAVRKATASCSEERFKSLRHEFLCVGVEDGATCVEYVVDLAFRDQFVIPNPTHRYKALLECVPEVFVGTVAALRPLVEALCQELAASFSGQRLQLPPWRSTGAMLSKWLPNHPRDVRYLPDGSKVEPPAPASSHRVSSCGSSSSDDDGGGSSSSPPCAPSDLHFQRVDSSASAGRCLQRRSLLSGKLLASTGGGGGGCSGISVHPPVHWGQPYIHSVRLK